MKQPLYYQRKPRSVPALQWDGSKESFWSLVGFTQGKFRGGDVNPQNAELYTSNDLWVSVPIGCWIIEASENSFVWCDKEEFDKDWERGRRPLPKNKKKASTANKKKGR